MQVQWEIFLLSVNIEFLNNLLCASSRVLAVELETCSLILLRTVNCKDFFFGLLSSESALMG